MIKTTKEQWKKALLDLGIFLVGKLGLGGFWGLVAKYVLKYVVMELVSLGVEWNEDIKAHRRLKKYTKILTNPELSDEERRKADLDFITGKL